jgi:hypothetical protein
MKNLKDVRRTPSDGNTLHGPLGLPPQWCNNMLSLNSKHVQHVKIYLTCNLRVNLITHLEVIALFSSNLKNVNTFHPLFQQL